uniref:Putative scf ubiquitin ligase skp2 component n=1 Tax=Ixodes ricinus TaxID=34613 RepID=A0A0K8RJM4_IXORI
MENAPSQSNASMENDALQNALSQSDAAMENDALQNALSQSDAAMENDVILPALFEDASENAPSQSDAAMENDATLPVLSQVASEDTSPSQSDAAMENDVILPLLIEDTFDLEDDPPSQSDAVMKNEPVEDTLALENAVVTTPSQIDAVLPVLSPSKNNLLPMGTYIRTYDNCIPYYFAVNVLRTTIKTNGIQSNIRVTNQLDWSELHRIFFTRQVTILSDLALIEEMPETVKYLRIPQTTLINDTLLLQVILRFPMLVSLDIGNSSTLTNRALAIISDKCQLEHLCLRQCRKMNNTALINLLSAKKNIRTLCIVGGKEMRFSTFRKIIHLQQKLLLAFCSMDKH